MWVRSVLAVVAGVVANFTADITTSPLFPMSFLRQTLYAFVGGMVAGLVAQRRGWVYGLLSALVMEGFILAFDIWAFGWAVEPRNLLMVRVEEWYSLCGGAVGGYVGGLIVLRMRRARAKQI